MTAAAGRKGAPANLRLVGGRGAGRDSGGRQVEEPPPFVRLPPECPELLWGDAKEEWERVVPELQRLKLTKPIDAASLTAYCLAWQRLCQAQRVIDEEGLFAMTSQGRGRHPAVAIVEAASKDLRSWASEFGLTPSAEGKLTKPEAGGGGEEDPFA